MATPRAFGNTFSGGGVGRAIADAGPRGSKRAKTRTGATLPVNRVRMWTSDRRLEIRALMGEGPAASSAATGWEEVDRPGQRSLTVWRRFGAPRLTFTIIFDGYDEGKDGRSVEANIRTLEKMAGGFDKADEPDPILVEGIIPHDFSQAPRNRWVIEEYAQVDAIRRDSDGARVRATYDLTLMLYTADNRLERLKPRGSAPNYRYIKAREKDTYEKVANRELDSKRLGGKLAKLNGRRSPDTDIRKGARIRVPTGDLLRRWKSELKRGSRKRR